MKKLIVMLSLLLAGCGASPTPQVVVVTATPEPATSTSLATSTSTETPTSTPTATSTPEPTPDLRVIDANPRDLVLTADDLPPEGRMYMDWESPGRNSEMISGWGADEGARYLESTGRIDGWAREFARGTRTARVPEYLNLNVIIYSKADLEWWDATNKALGTCTSYERSLGKKATVLPDPSLGDKSVLCLTKVMQSSGKNMMYYEMWIGYRNIGFQVWGQGLEGSFDQDWLVNIAKLQADKITGYPLADMVTYQP